MSNNRPSTAWRATSNAPSTGPAALVNEMIATTSASAPKMMEFVIHDAANKAGATRTPPTMAAAKAMLADSQMGEGKKPKAAKYRLTATPKTT